MSQDRRPSPVQPPFSDNPADIMAQVQRSSMVPNPSFFSRTDQPSSQAVSLPPIHVATSRGPPSYEGRSLPPIRLPPINASPQEMNLSSRPLGRVMGVTDLLSEEAQPPRGVHQQPDQQMHPPFQPQPFFQATSPYDAGRRSLNDSPASSYGNSPHDQRIQRPSNLPAAPHYLDREPLQLRQPPQSHFQQQHPPSYHLHYPSTSSEPEQLQFSPVTASQSFAASRHESSSEPSPRTSRVPSTTYPSQPEEAKVPTLNYTLGIRQQPAAARACGFGERDRRVIDPPPILELKITDQATSTPEQDLGGLLALHCTLISQDGKDDETEVPPAHPEMPSSRRLMGTLVASPYQAKDDSGIAGTFFVFPDLSCRSPGKFRLHFKLIRIDAMNMRPGVKHHCVSSVITDVFSVYTAKDFPGMRASSALLKSLRRQGLNVGVKKGSEARKGKGKAKKGDSSDEEESGSDDDDQEVERRGSGGSRDTGSTGNFSPKTKKRRKGKKRRLDS